MILRLGAGGLALFLLAGCTAPPLTYTSRTLDKTRHVAILPFLDYKESNNSGQLVTNLFTMYFLQNGVKVAEREKINQVILEKGMDLAGFNEKSAQEFGQVLNVDYILIGAVTDYTSYSTSRKLFYIFEWMQIIGTVGVTARLIDVRAGEIIWVGTASEKSYSFNDAADQVVGTLFQTMRLQ